MAIIEQELSSMFASKDEIRQLVAEVNARMGFVPDPTATPEKGRQLMLADGIGPEENAFTAELMKMRYEKNQCYDE